MPPPRCATFADGRARGLPTPFPRRAISGPRHLLSSHTFLTKQMNFSCRIFTTPPGRPKIISSWQAGVANSQDAKVGLMVAGLGAEEVAAFHRDGWVVARQLLPPATVQLLSAPLPTQSTTPPSAALRLAGPLIDALPL